MGIVLLDQINADWRRAVWHDSKVRDRLQRLGHGQRDIDFALADAAGGGVDLAQGRVHS